MFYKKRNNILYRNYGSFYYLTDNRNFGYGQAPERVVGDKIVSESGATFLSALENEPQYIDRIVEKINKNFPSVDHEIIKKDAIEFFDDLERCGFIVAGNTYSGCYKNEIDPNIEIKSDRRGFSKNDLIKATQMFFDEYFNNKPQLVSIHVEITNKCNERCLHCYIPHSDKMKVMESSVFYDIIEQCKQMNVLHITISGGEPMLHDEFIGFLKRCNEYNLSINILTNLTLLNDEFIEEMKNNKLLSVQTSLYSIDPEVHDHITGNHGSCEKTKNAILRLIKNGIPVQISCPIMHQNSINYQKAVVEVDT